MAANEETCICSRSGIIMELPPDEKPPEPTQNTYGNLTKESFYSSIDEVIKIEPLTPRDGATYIFKFDFGGTRGSIELDVTDLLKNYRKFEELLISHFNIALPSVMKRKSEPFQPSEWSLFIKMCLATCISVSPHESTEWAECDRFLERVSGFNVMEETQKKEWGANSSTSFNLLKQQIDGKLYYVLKSDDITSLFTSMKILVTREKMGKVMKQRGTKRESEGVVRVGKKVIRAWWLTEESLIEHGLNFEESRINVVVGALLDQL